ncbi:SDR family oxidoreductase [Paenibacillus kandeliae]|uniref:SDR family oxidoreductase n=1 Tax=Paenibacillus kandeliae TaxID=3231269 RepID=UPI0034596EAB
MRVFVTGATGYIGSATVHELLNAGHQVISLARSDESAAKLQQNGVEAHQGDIYDLDTLREGTALADGVIHLAFNHDFSQFTESLETDLKAIEAMADALKGSGKPFVMTTHANGTAAEQVMQSAAKHGVRTCIIELCPSVHGEGDTGFIPRLIDIARTQGYSAYVNNGDNCWTAVHRLDAAHLYRLALEKAPACSRLHGVADEEVSFRDIAGMIGKQLHLPVVSIPHEQATTHFGFLGTLAALDIPRSSAVTRDLLGWYPIQPSLLDDLQQPHYFSKK